MHRSWSMPVAQALQRHSGGWRVKPPEAHAEDQRPADQPPLDAPQDRSRMPATALDDRATMQGRQRGDAH
jgi:hypothetical protein